MTPRGPATLAATAPTTLVGADGPLEARWVGRLTAGLVEPVPGRGRVRRWSYAAAASADGRTQVGAAVVDLGLAGTAFAWLLQHVEGRPEVLTFEQRLPGWRVRVPAEHDAVVVGRGSRVVVGARGGLVLALDAATTADGRRVPVHVDLAAEPTSPVATATATPAGGWNATEKEAGHRVVGTVAVGDDLLEFQGRGWRDWTCGRQDRRTTWRWAAGAGVAADGRALGLNASTGMNAAGVGEDVAWVDGRPVALDVAHLAPAGDDPAGAWEVGGPGWGLHFEPLGLRAADEDLLLVRSRYVQPIGTFHGTLPTPDGGVLEVACLPGVTEDHEARW